MTIFLVATQNAFKGVIEGGSFEEADNNSKEEARGGRALPRLSAGPQSRQELAVDLILIVAGSGQHTRQALVNTTDKL